MANADPSTRSGAHNKMSPGWQMVDDILAGPEAIRAAGTRYLPKYGAESQAEYDRRRKQAPWSAEFEDILRSLASKPFAKDVSLKAGASSAIEQFVEDVDQRGNSITAFARELFESGIAKGCHGILVDNTGDGQARTLAEEKAQRPRPYWVTVRAEDILDLRTAFVGGREMVVHLRLSECETVREGYDEKTVDRVREYNREALFDDEGRTVAYGPATWVLWEKQASPSQAGGSAWEPIGGGQLKPVTDIPLVMFWTGRRKGSQFVQPPLLALADKQIELYRALSRQDETLTYAGSPMLSAQGVAPPPAGETVEVGPKRILYAPGDSARGGWSYIQPDAANLREIRENIASLVEDIRRLGMQPLAQRSGAVTATATSIEGARAHSAVQAWALGLKDVLEQALVYTSQWLAEQPSAEVTVHTDFLAGVADQVPLDALAKARAAGAISREAYVEALKRFGVLAPDFDVAADEERIAEETQGLEAEPAAMAA